MITWRQFGLQDATSAIISQLTGFHDHAILILTLVITFVTYARTTLLINKYKCRNIYEAQEIEIVWTVLPAIFLLFLALPSLRLLYLIDELTSPAITLKTVGHQWYWSYEYSDFLNLEFDSYIIPEEELLPGQHRLLEVDNRVILPIKTQIRIIVTAADVIHSWAIPRIGIKIDAIPGRLNQIGFSTPTPGIIYGQCSEICGANHTFIPIALEVISLLDFNNWILSVTE
jgi:cytochrome c oxidase subunit 2